MIAKIEINKLKYNFSYLVITKFTVASLMEFTCINVKIIIET